MRLSGALDSEVHIAVQRFLNDGVASDPSSIYSALQRSNSSLKRRPKRVLLDSIERVLDFIEAETTTAPANDSEAEVELNHLNSTKASDYLNKSLRANLAEPSTEPSPTPKPPKRMTNGEPAPKRLKSEKPALLPPSGISLSDFGGIDDIISQVESLLVLPMQFPDIFVSLNAPIPKGILLHGPPGCGKTMLAQAVAAELGVPFISIAGPSIVSGMSGESEKAVRERFDEARKNAPCIIFFDEIDAIAPKRESSQSQMEKRIVAQLLTCIDELSRDDSKPVIVLAATNRVDSLDPALRRGGRFDAEIEMGVPNESAREDILKAKTHKTPLSADVDLRKLAKMTAGYVGADLAHLVSKASSWEVTKCMQNLRALAIRQQHEAMDVDSQPPARLMLVERVRNLIALGKNKDSAYYDMRKDISLSMQAFESVLPTIVPSSKREGFATIPNVSWNDIGALDSVRDTLQRYIVRPIQNPESYRSMGSYPPTGVLLWGPPGCGKTLLAKAAAAESKANFISVKGPELLNKFVGESEAAVRRVFTRAHASKPCVIFFDELDALVPNRDGDSSEVSNRVVNTLLSELDGLEQRSDIWVIGATNRPEAIDSAIIRPGRFGKPLFVGLPSRQGRIEIIRTIMRGKKSVSNLEAIVDIVAQCEGYSGADINALVSEANILRTEREGAAVEPKDFAEAAKQIKGSVHSMGRYDAMKERFAKVYVQ